MRRRTQSTGAACVAGQHSQHSQHAQHSQPGTSVAGDATGLPQFTVVLHTHPRRRLDRITTPHAADGPENTGRGGGQQADIQLARAGHIAGLTTALPLRRSAAATANRPSAPPACRAPASPPASPPAPAPASASKSRSTGDEWRSRPRSRLHTQCGSPVGVRVAKLWTEPMKTTNACVSCCCSITRLPSYPPPRCRWPRTC